MSGDSDTDVLSPIGFTYEYAGHGWARASISDGVTTYHMTPSDVPTDPLLALMRAVVEVLCYGGSAGCTWFYEPARGRWTLRREGAILHIAIRVGRDFLRLDWPDEGGELQFSTRGDPWKFAAKVRLAASRLSPAAETGDDPSWLKQTPEYGALYTLLDEHKRAGQPPSGTKPT